MTERKKVGKKGLFPCLCPPTSVMEFQREEAVISSHPSFTSSPPVPFQIYTLSRWGLYLVLLWEGKVNL